MCAVYAQYMSQPLLASSVNPPVAGATYLTPANIFASWSFVIDGAGCQLMFNRAYTHVHGL